MLWSNQRTIRPHSRTRPPVRGIHSTAESQVQTRSEEDGMAALTCEVVYRGIFQKNLAARITRGIVLSARKAGRWGIAFGRYGDSPQRNGIPAKDFAIVAHTNQELDQNMARYERNNVDVTTGVDYHRS